MGLKERLLSEILTTGIERCQRDLGFCQDCRVLREQALFERLGLRR